MKSIYFPFVYLSQVKRVNQNYVVNSILLDDFPMLFIAFSWLNPFPILNAIGILCLIFSFWCIYEFGYYENDLVADKYEKQPVLSETYHQKSINIKWWQPWLWSLPIAVLGITLVIFSELGSFTSISSTVYASDRYLELLSTCLIAFIKWFCFLLVSRILFFLYNYVNKQTRILLYPILHCSRYCGFFVLAKSNWIGISLIISHVLARSASYIVYRYAGGHANSWPKLQDWFLRLMLFLIFISIISMAESTLSFFINWQTILLVLWWAKKCRKQFIEIVKNIKPIWEES